jgi:hypothetical protein
MGDCECECVGDEGGNVAQTGWYGIPTAQKMLTIRAVRWSTPRYKDELWAPIKTYSS